jgi:hypothetical protein
MLSVLRSDFGALVSKAQTSEGASVKRSQERARDDRDACV